MRCAFLLFILVLSASVVTAREPTEEELEKWFNSDEPDMEQQAIEVNEGDLEFLPQLPSRAVHHHHNTIIITPRSLYDGWVNLKQCHENLDQIGLAQVVFRKDRARKLKVRFAENIGRAWVEGPSIQLKDVGKGARLCLELETRSLESLGDGTFVIRNGPYMRRFLDGYYPMHVSVDVIFASKVIQFLSVTPEMQNGFRVWHNDNSLHIDSWFKGRLSTEIHFFVKGSS